jgi:septum formation protein
VILLASRSPQRRALLAALGIPFRVAVSGVAEGVDALDNARRKARAVAGRVGVPPGGAVLAADTEVLLDGRALGKPAHPAGARDMVAALAGRAHVVESAIVVVSGAGEHEARAATRVTVRELPPAALDWYVATGEWRERAGGYAIQGAGAALVERIDGDYTTVVGLPVSVLIELLVPLGLGPWR